MKPKTKDEVIDLSNQIKDLEKYKNICDAADELKRVHAVFVNSGFTPDQATILVNTLLTNAIKNI